MISSSPPPDTLSGCRDAPDDRDLEAGVASGLRHVVYTCFRNPGPSMGKARERKAVRWARGLRVEASSPKAPPGPAPTASRLDPSYRRAGGRYRAATFIEEDHQMDVRPYLLNFPHMVFDPGEGKLTKCEF